MSHYYSDFTLKEILLFILVDLNEKNNILYLVSNRNKSHPYQFEEGTGICLSISPYKIYKEKGAPTGTSSVMTVPGSICYSGLK